LLLCSGLRERILRQAQRIALGRKGQGLRPGLLAKVSKLGAEGCLKLLDFRLALLSQIKGVGGAACGPEGEKEGQPAQRTPPEPSPALTPARFPSPQFPINSGAFIIPLPGEPGQSR